MTRHRPALVLTAAIVNIVAAGNAAVFNAHPAAAKCAAVAVRAYNEAIYRETGIENIATIIERPSMLASGLPGKRVEANRAGMMATTSSGSALSTAEPVDAGCTTNNNTTRKCPCYDHR